MVAELCHVVLSCFRGEKAPRENPPNGDLFVFSHGDLSPRHTTVRHFSCVAFSPSVCRIFAWRGERSPCENPTKSPFGGFFAWRPFAFSPRKHVYTTWHKSATIMEHNPAIDLARFSSDQTFLFEKHVWVQQAHVSSFLLSTVNAIPVVNTPESRLLKFLRLMQA